MRLDSGLDNVIPSEYLPSVFDGAMPEFRSGEQASESMARCFFSMEPPFAAPLLRDDAYFAILFEDKAGKCQANDWVHGYMAGVQVRGKAGLGHSTTKKNGGMIVPFMALHFEHDKDPEYRLGPINDAKREEAGRPTDRYRTRHLPLLCTDAHIKRAAELLNRLG